MKDKNKQGSDEGGVNVRVPAAGLLTWLLPGAGHLFIGERARGVILITAIAVTYWGGVAIGGVTSTVDVQERRLWFVAQICAGGHTLATMALGSIVEARTTEDLRAYGRAEEIAVVYTAICGMLNILILFDVLVRAERQAPVAAARAGERAPPRRTREKKT